MGRKKAKNSEKLQYRLYTRVNEDKFKEFQRLLLQNPANDMSSLLREILYERPVTVLTRDLTLDNLMEELAALRKEIRAIGININQMTRLFNTYPEPVKKQFYAKIAFKEYQAIQPRIERVLLIISKLSKKWLPE